MGALEFILLLDSSNAAYCNLIYRTGISSELKIWEDLFKIKKADRGLIDRLSNEFLFPKSWV